MERREQDAAVPAFVLDILEAADEVGDAAEADEEACDGRPGTVGARSVVSDMEIQTEFLFE